MLCYLFLILRVYRLLGIGGKGFKYRRSLEITCYYSLNVFMSLLVITQLSRVALSYFLPVLELISLWGLQLLRFPPTVLCVLSWYNNNVL